jgi:hypothetical protein
MWSQFGKPRPPPPYKSFSTEDCSGFSDVNISKKFNPLFENNEAHPAHVGKNFNDNIR